MIGGYHYFWKHPHKQPTLSHSFSPTKNLPTHHPKLPHPAASGTAPVASVWHHAADPVPVHAGASGAEGVSLRPARTNGETVRWNACVKHMGETHETVKHDETHGETFGLSFLLNLEGYISTDKEVILYNLYMSMLGSCKNGPLEKRRCLFC